MFNNNSNFAYNVMSNLQPTKLIFFYQKFTFYQKQTKVISFVALNYYLYYCRIINNILHISYSAVL